MDDPPFLPERVPIGSGVTEAAKKSLVRQSHCGSGKRAKTRGAKMVISPRADPRGRAPDPVRAQDRPVYAESLG
jgi:hypothetical protein